MMPRVVVLQLVTRGQGRHAHILAEENDPPRRPESFNDPGSGVSPVRFGSQDLLLLAENVLHAGFQVHSLDLRDSHAQQLSSDADDVEADLLNWLRHGQIDSVFSFLDGAGRGIYVWGINLRDKQVGGMLSLTRDGALVSFGGADAIRFVISLNEALEED